MSKDRLDKYKLSLKPAPREVLTAIGRGVQALDFPSRDQAQSVLGETTPPANQVLRNGQGQVLVSCVTDMPGVTPAMIDWWFGWHMPSSERYRLWHPEAHVRSVPKEDRTHMSDIRARYTGNVSYVDEYIGGALKRLAIAFVPPETFNILKLEEQQATAVCAFTSDRMIHGEGGCLVHYVIPTPSGAQMRSGFWLGDIRHHNRMINRMAQGLLNTKFVRRLVVTDQMALDLLQHCAEEMNHLARFLPGLHADLGDS